MTIGVYRILCLVSGKMYVGSSQDIEERWKWHQIMLNADQHHSQALQRAWKKYGELGFEFEILEECHLGDLNMREQHYIDTLNSVGPHGYNCHPTAGSARGFKQSEETKQKQRESRARYLETPGARESLRDRAKKQHLAGKLGQKTWKDNTIQRMSDRVQAAWNKKTKDERLAHGERMRQKKIENNCRASRGET